MSCVGRCLHAQRNKRMADCSKWFISLICAEVSFYIEENWNTRFICNKKFLIQRTAQEKSWFYGFYGKHRMRKVSKCSLGKYLSLEEEGWSWSWFNSVFLVVSGFLFKCSIGFLGSLLSKNFSFRGSYKSFVVSLQSVDCVFLGGSRRVCGCCKSGVCSVNCDLINGWCSLGSR